MLESLKKKLAVSNEIIIKVNVSPSASRDVIKGVMANEAIKILVSAPPEDNKANKAVIKLLAQELGLKAVCLTIENGLTSKQKTIRVRI